MFSRVIQKGRRIISQNLKCKKCECIRLYTEDKKTIAQRFSWLLSQEDLGSGTVVDGLKKSYFNKLLPLEKHYLFHRFHSPQLNEADFDSLPLVLLIGQYSTGKTSMIKYLIGSEYPDSRVGPEPTTDRFIVICNGETNNSIPGHALVMDHEKQFSPLSKFGSSFLNRFQMSTCPAPTLTGLSLVDTPGILSGEKQRQDRGYDFSGVVEWFAERGDRILLLFDAHKLDISDEFRSCIEALRGHEDKIRIILNKADLVEQQELMRVYGALMWSLGKVFQTPEVARVYIGSFWDKPLRYEMNSRLFFAEEQDLFSDLYSLHRNSTLRKLNDMIKRARLAKAHAHILTEIQRQMPMFLGKEAKKRELLEELPKICKSVEEEYNIPAGDFPDIARLKQQLSNMDWSELPRGNPVLLEAVQDMMRNDITALVKKIPTEHKTKKEAEPKSEEKSDEKKLNISEK
ncbi:EH domain-containing protein 1 [Eurytemora carolleeae]|uniref:EH domain-containing protein 1 n=1 Tax=Eurytemora carolleeae TaxID=1294199 RepID=UPI000C77AB9E|nr:EH domain-containing protein 1 [Eurytemora carolleeae]|eukprot:XP_023341306.1 EH domain-containing protein 1-like [Eurytemora affinis]